MKEVEEERLMRTMQRRRSKRNSSVKSENTLRKISSTQYASKS